MKKLLLATAVAMPLMVSSAWATVIFTLGNHPQPNEENILFGAAETGTIINGLTNQSGIPVVFDTLTGQTLDQTAKGQADITNSSGGQLTSMEMSAPGFTFEDAIMDLNFGTGSAHVVALASTGQTFDYNLGPGQNFLTLTTTGGETISDIKVTETAGTTGFGWNDFKQPRISGLTAPLCPPGDIGAPPNCHPSEVLPEPTSLLILGSGILGLGLALRRRRHQ